MALAGSCLPIILTCFVIGALVDGRSLKIRHGHRPHADYRELEESLPRDLSSPRRLVLENELYRESYRRPPVDRLASSEEEDGLSEELRRSPSSSSSSSSSVHRHVGRHETRDVAPFSQQHRGLNELFGRYDDDGGGFGARRKRHNHHPDVRKVTDQDQRDFRSSMQHGRFDADDVSTSEFYELEVKEAQNSSICNYTVIPDNLGSRVPRDLEHVMCNHAGSRCKSPGHYCCIQTYRMIEVSYDGGTTKPKKIYAGCVCAHLQPQLVESSRLRKDE